MQRSLIAGASSFLGGTIARALLARGDDVHVLVRDGTLAERLPDEIPEQNRHLIDDTTESLAAAVEQSSPDVTYQLAGMYLRHPEMAQVVPLIQSNFQFGIQLAETLSRGPKPVKLVNIGTYSQYFNSIDPRPLDLYSALKQAYVGALDYYREAFDFQSVSLILYDSYGIGDWRKKIIFALREAVKNGTVLPLSDPGIVMDLIHIEDAAAACIHGADTLSPDLSGKTCSVSGERLTLGDLVALFGDIAGHPIKAQWGAYPLPERRIMEPWLGSCLPGWKPTIPLREGLTQLIESDR